MRIWLALLLFWPLATVAHIGSPNIYYEGNAGPYALQVIIRPPDVIPGRAEITVRALDGNVQSISVLPAKSDTGTKGAPSADPAKPVRGDANLFSAELWLMTTGAYTILVQADGAAGRGTTVVPINSVATSRRVMPRGFGAMLGTWAGVLVLALVCLVGSAVRESVLPPGEVPTRKRTWLSRGAMVVGAFVIATGLWGGRAWWNLVDRDYRNNRLYRADDLRATVTTNAAHLVLKLRRTNERGTARSLVPEHGKLMHAFVVRQPTLDAFAHLHPLRIDDQNFETTLPPLPAGNYKVYADVTHASGQTHTLVADVALPASAATAIAKADEDDSWASSSSPARSEAHKTCVLSDGFTMHQIAIGNARMQFKVVDSDGKPAALEPYMTMQAHAVVHSHDATVFTHLHPFGTVSMTSQQLFAKRERERSNKPFEVVCGLPARPDVIVFPYEFPKPGAYRVWVQVKINGQVVTGFFDHLAS
jgi:hypothetical protein